MSVSQSTFDKAVEPIYQRLLRYATIRAGRNDAADILQDALLTAWNLISNPDNHRLPTLTDPAHLWRWLREILENHCKSNLRARSRSREIPFNPIQLQSLADIVAMGDVRDHDAMDAETWLLTQRYLTDLIHTTPLTRRQRHCVTEWLDEKPQAAIAEELEITQQAVSAHIQSAVTVMAWWRKELPESAVKRFTDLAKIAMYFAPQTVGSALARERLAAMR